MELGWLTPDLQVELVDLFRVVTAWRHRPDAKQSEIDEPLARLLALMGEGLRVPERLWWVKRLHYDLQGALSQHGRFLNDMQSAVALVDVSSARSVWREYGTASGVPLARSVSMLRSEPEAFVSLPRSFREASAGLLGGHAQIVRHLVNFRQEGTREQLRLASIDLVNHLDALLTAADDVLLAGLDEMRMLTVRLDEVA